MSNSLNLELPYVQGAQAQKHVHRERCAPADRFGGAAYGRRPQPSAPPSGPQEGDRHIVAASPTGGWVGHPFEVAAYQDGAWVFFTPKEGWIAYNLSENALLYFDGASWRSSLPLARRKHLQNLGSMRRRMIPSGFLWNQSTLCFRTTPRLPCRRAMPRLSLTRLYQPILRHIFFSATLSVTPSWGWSAPIVCR
jgi:hypothetical protein